MSFLDRAPVSSRIFDALCAHPYGLTAKELVDIVYADDPDGGPDWAYESIGLCAWRINHKAKKEGLGVRIRGHGGPGSKYLIYVVRA